MKATDTGLLVMLTGALRGVVLGRKSNSNILQFHNCLWNIFDADKHSEQMTIGSVVMSFTLRQKLFLVTLTESSIDSREFYYMLKQAPAIELLDEGFSLEELVNGIRAAL